MRGVTLTIVGCLVTCICFLVIPRNGLAQSAAQVDRWTWKVGDRWTYEWKGIRAGKPGGNGRYTLVVVRTGDYEGTPAYFVQVDRQWVGASGKPGKDQFTVVRDMDLTVLARMDAQGKVFSRVRVGWLKWPLLEGAQWSVDGTYEFLDRGNWVKRHESDASFGKGMEDITTAAGTFHGLHVQTVSRWSNDSGVALGHQQEDDWFSSEARIWVKYVRENGDYQEEGEVVEYHLAP